ncbi:MAG: hypothetical protein ABIJ46_02280 [bacterium]
MSEDNTMNPAAPQQDEATAATEEQAPAEAPVEEKPATEESAN